MNIRIVSRLQRFGSALLFTGQINLKNKKFARDFGPVDPDCTCSTCKTYTRAYLNSIVTHEAVACHLLTVHNVAFQLRLMKTIRESIKEGKFPEFVQKYMAGIYPDKNYPKWTKEALEAAGINLS